MGDMAAKATRALIIERADQLFYEKGFARTSFSDIAEAVQISRGNFYYHFKTKDDILAAVIAHRLARTQDMLQAWQAEGGSPAERILCFIRILVRNQDKIMRYGCPVGSLSMELAKLKHAAQESANQLFALFREWLRAQFEELGCGERSDALAMHVLGCSQGVATLANVFHDEQFIEQEVQQMCSWLGAIQAEYA